ncbi:MAG: SufD family Fe-S cluster assembly protein [Bacillota bacterium]|nr:SufD family Fe-S cluster assembly protein [Bacillota bacterium]
MENKEQLILNHIPVLTWNRLKMNYETVSNPGKLENLEFNKKFPANVLYEKQSLGNEVIKTGVGQDISDLLIASQVDRHYFKLGSGEKTQDPIRLDFNIEKGKLGTVVELEVEQGAEASLIMDYRSQGSGFAAIQTRLKVGKAGKINLVQIQRIGQDLDFVNDLGCHIEADGKVQVIRLILSGDNSFDGANFILDDRAELATNIGYMVEKDHRLDMNYLVEHKGVNSLSNMDVEGVLRDTAYKMFRGTIDIQHGADQAKGNENENVLMLDEGVVNKSVPIILCAEENVEGNHGATMGRLDEDLMFYLLSRGIKKEEIYELMAKARLLFVANKIEDPLTKKMVIEEIGGFEND